MQHKHFNAGVALAAAMNGISEAEMFEKAAFTNALEGSKDRGQMICRMAASMFEECGKQASLSYHLYDRLSKTASWDPSFESFISPVTESLSVVMDQIDEEEMTKAAVGAGGVLSGLVGRGVGMTPAAVRTLAAAGVLTGAGIGSLAWYANKDSTEDEADLEALQARIKNYDRITNEINERLAAEGLDPYSQEAEEVIQDSANTDYVA